MFEDWTEQELNEVTTELRKRPIDKRAGVRDIIKDMDTAQEALKAISDVLAPNTGKSTTKPIKPPKKTLERVKGVEIPKEIDIDQIKQDITETINTFCLQYDIEDMTKAPQRQFNALCTVIGQNIFRANRLLKDDTKQDNGSYTDTNCNAYNWDRVVKAISIYEFLCNRYNKAFLITTCADFLGMVVNTLYENAEKLTRLGYDIRQKQEQSLSSSAVDTKTTNITGILASLNHWHGWTQAHTHTERTTEKVIAYPVLVDINKDKVVPAIGQQEVNTQ